MSNLSAFPYIQERSEATPGLWNNPFSIISANMEAINSDVTIDFASGNTLSVLSSIDATQHIHASGQIGLGPTPSAVTTGMMTLAVDSSLSDYIHFEDTSGAKSDYLLGSRVGGTADGLNLWDLSGNTMIVSFSKQSIRFYQQVVGSVFDVGGAHFNVRAYGATGDGTTDDTGGVQAAVTALTLAGGGGLYFPEGTYRLTSTITIDPSPSAATFGKTSIYGESRGGSVILPETTRVFNIGNGSFNYEGLDIRNLHFSLRTDLNWNNGVVRLAFVRSFTIDNLAITGGPVDNLNLYAGYLLELDSSYNGVIRNCESWGRYTYLYDLNSISRPTEQQDTVWFERPLTLGQLQGIVRYTDGNYHNLTWQNLKHVVTLAGDDSQDDNTTLSALHVAGVSGLTVAATASLDTNDPILVGSGRSVEINKITAITTNRLTLFKPTRFVHESGESVLHGGVAVSLDNNIVNAVFREPHFENGAVGILADGPKQLVIERPYHGSRDMVRVVGAGVQDLTVMGGTYAGNSSVDSIVHILGAGDSSNVARLLFVGPFTTLSGSQVSLYVNDAGTDRQRRVIGTQIAGNLADDARYAATSSTVTIDQVVAGGTLLFAKVLDGRTYQSGRMGLGVWPPNHNIDFSQDIAGPSGSAIVPVYTYTSEVSLGWYRSAASTMALSYGTILTQLVRISNPGGDNYILGNTSGASRMQTGVGGFQFLGADNNYTRINASIAGLGTDGTALSPTIRYNSEESLGFFRSTSSTIVMSYGTLSLKELYVTGSGISIGNATAGGSLIPAISSTSSLVAAFVVQGSSSSFTRIIWAAAQPGDHILVTPGPTGTVSSISSGLVAHSHCTQAGQVEFRLSNVSTLVQNQSTRTWYFTRISPF